MRHLRTQIAAVLAGAAITTGAAVPAASAQAQQTGQQQQTQTALKGAADGTAKGAVAWYSKNNGKTGWEHYCEKAAENAYGTTGIYASAIKHWNSAGGKHKGDKNPPVGAFVYWKISEYGHVGISDGKGGFWATSVNGKIGHVTKDKGGYGYFTNYLGWTPAKVPK